MGSASVPLHGDSDYHVDPYFWRTKGDLRWWAKKWLQFRSRRRQSSVRLHPPPTSGKAVLPVPQAGRVVPNPRWVSPSLDRFGNPNWRLSHPSSNYQQSPSRSRSSSPVAYHGHGLAFFVSLPNNSSCFQPVLNPPGNPTLPRRRVLLYVISRQQLWPRHPERGSLCRTVVSGMNFPSPPTRHHLFKGRWKRS